MAILTPDPAVDMKTVAEVDVIGKLVNTLPWNRVIFIVILGKLDYFRLGLSRDRVAIHAGTWRWYDCKPGSVDSDVAVCTINFHGAGMQLVRKVYRLRRRISYALSRWPGYKVCYRDRSQCDEYEDRSPDPQRVFQKGPVHCNSLTENNFEIAVWKGASPDKIEM